MINGEEILNKWKIKFHNHNRFEISSSYGTFRSSSFPHNSNHSRPVTLFLGSRCIGTTFSFFRNELQAGTMHLLQSIFQK